MAQFAITQDEENAEDEMAAHAFYSTGGSHNLNTQEEISPPLKVGSSLDIASPPAVAYDEFNDSISPVHHTLRAGTKQSTGALASIVRRLTPVECERLQGFPDDWTAGQADSHRYKQMGNAVTVNVVEWVGKAIMAAEKEMGA